MISKFREIHNNQSNSFDSGLLDGVFHETNSFQAQITAISLFFLKKSYSNIFSQSWSKSIMEHSKNLWNPWGIGRAFP